MLNNPADLSEKDKKSTEISEPKKALTEENEHLKNRIDKMTDLLLNLVK